MSPLLELKDVHARFGRVQALSAINLHVLAGERLALVGANGSGKSTLLRVLHGLVAPTSGTLTHDSAVRQAMVFQRPYMLHASALFNVAVGLVIRGIRWKDAKARAVQALAQVGLQNYATRNARHLSGGQQQRLALARAWSLQPSILLLDEPTSSLDPHAKREIEGLMATFASSGLTLVFASHNLGHVKRLATRVVYLEGGRLLVDLPVQDFFNGSMLAENSPQAALFVKGELA